MKTLAEIMYEQEEIDTQNAINTLKTIAEKMSAKIKDAILSIDKPFNKTDLFYHMKHEHGIDNRQLICEVLDSLCENGILKYVEVENDCWAFVKSAS